MYCFTLLASHSVQNMENPSGISCIYWGISYLEMDFSNRNESSITGNSYNLNFFESNVGNWYNIDEDNSMLFLRPNL